MERTLWLIILTLSQAVLIALEVIRTRSDHRHKLSPSGNLDSPADPPPCQEHGEKLAEYGARLKNLENTAERIERKINGEQ